MDRADSGLNTSLTIPTAAMEPGTRYYVSVRAWNQAGLQTTLVSDGVVIDLTPPAGGVVFPTRHYGNQHAQSSTTTLAASWHSFEDRHSGVTSYYAALYDADDVTTPVVPYTGVGILTQFVFSGLSLKHGHRFVDNDDTKNRPRSMVVVVAACIIIVVKCSLLVFIFLFFIFLSTSLKCRLKSLNFFRPSVQQMCSYVRIENKSMTSSQLCNNY